ncbi:hypothetical protein [Flavobacterium sp. SM2513]|uniref:hypothetical protein n=1 Tax=Flavobacterium sp. SM2513 TaxID=3424766 RepID=UPI003D7F6E4F
MPTRKPFPSKESELNTYFKLVVAYLTLHINRLHVSETNKTLINELYNEWFILYPLSKNLYERTTMIVTNKNRVRDSLMNTLRKVFADIPKSELTLQDRLTLHLPERKSNRSAPVIPTTHPLGHIFTGNLYQHTIFFTDENGSHAKPKRVRGCQIWCKIGEPITDLKDTTFLGTCSAPPFLHKFALSDAGKTVHYRLRWENTRGEAGPWSPVVRATVNGD